MVSCGILLKTAVILLVTLVATASAAPEKLASCCTTVSRQEIREPITGYMVQKKNLPCVTAIIFQTDKGVFCSQFNAPWVRQTIKNFEVARRNAKPTSPLSISSTPSLLSFLTSSSSPSSSSPSSSSPTSLPPTSFSSSSQ